MSSNDSSATGDVKVVNMALQGVKSTLLSTVSSADSAIRRLNYDKDLLGGVSRDHKYDLSAKLEGTKRKLNQLRRMSVVEKYSGYLSLLFFHAVVVYIIAKRLRLLLLLSTLWSATKHLSMPRNATTTAQVANKTAEIVNPSLTSMESSVTGKTPISNVEKKSELSSDLSQITVEVDGIAEVTISSSNSDRNCLHIERGQCISLLYQIYSSGNDDECLYIM